MWTAFGAGAVDANATPGIRIKASSASLIFSVWVFFFLLFSLLLLLLPFSVPHAFILFSKSAAFVIFWLLQLSVVLIACTLFDLISIRTLPRLLE